MTRSLNYGGAECRLVELARGLKQAGESVAVMTLYGGRYLTHELGAAWRTD